MSVRRWAGLGLLIVGVLGLLLLWSPFWEDAAAHFGVGWFFVWLGAPHMIGGLLVSLLPGLIGLFLAASAALGGLVLLFVPENWSRTLPPEVPLPERLPPEE